MFKRKPKVLTPQEMEEIRTKDFFDCILPGTIKFLSDHYILGDNYRKPESYTLEELCSETPSVYQYVFTLEHAWKYHYGSKGTALSDVQKDLDAQYAYYGLERPESYYGRLNEGIAREMTEGQAESQGPALTM